MTAMQFQQMFEGLSLRGGPRVNVALLRKTLEVVEEEAVKLGTEECRWDQGSWRCGTGMCFAGWAVHLDGAKWASEDGYSDHYDDVVAEPGDNVTSVPWDDVTPGVTAVVSVAIRAQQILGLTDDEANVLFAASNDIDDIQCCTSDILERAAQ